MVLVIQERQSHFHDNIVPEAVNEIGVLLASLINREIEHVSVRSVGSHPNFYAIFCWLCGHVLVKIQPTLESNHPFINRNIFPRIICMLNSCSKRHLSELDSTYTNGRNSAIPSLAHAMNR